MSDPCEELERLLWQALDQHDSLAMYFRLAEQSGFSLVVALDAIDWNAHWLEEHPVSALIEHCGSTERAQLVLDQASPHHRAIDAARWVQSNRVKREVNDAILAHAPLDEIAARLRSPLLEGHEREWFWASLASTRPLAELAHLVPDALTGQGAIARALRARLTSLGALDALRDAGIAAAAAIELLQRSWDAPSSPESDPALALLDIHAQLLDSASRPVRLALASLESGTELARWLPVLRRRGLSATAAALFMHEQVPPLEATAIARALHDAGYDDDAVLRALLENGLSSARALRLLGEHGWSVDRMVGSLVARDALLPDVRDHLLALGLPRPAITDVLLRHAPQELVALTMRDGDR